MVSNEFVSSDDNVSDEEVERALLSKRIQDDMDEASSSSTGVKRTTTSDDEDDDEEESQSPKRKRLKRNGKGKARKQPKFNPHQYSDLNRQFDGHFDIGFDESENESTEDEDIIVPELSHTHHEIPENLMDNEDSDKVKWSTTIGISEPLIADETPVFGGEPDRYGAATSVRSCGKKIKNYSIIYKRNPNRIREYKVVDNFRQDDPLSGLNHNILSLDVSSNNFMSVVNLNEKAREYILPYCTKISIDWSAMAVLATKAAEHELPDDLVARMKNYYVNRVDLYRQIGLEKNASLSPEDAIATGKNMCMDATDSVLTWMNANEKKARGEIHCKLRRDIYITVFYLLVIDVYGIEDVKNIQSFYHIMKIVYEKTVAYAANPENVKDGILEDALDELYNDNEYNLYCNKTPYDCSSQNSFKSYPIELLFSDDIMTTLNGTFRNIISKKKTIKISHTLMRTTLQFIKWTKQYRIRVSSPHSMAPYNRFINTNAKTGLAQHIYDVIRRNTASGINIIGFALNVYRYNVMNYMVKIMNDVIISHNYSLVIYDKDALTIYVEGLNIQMLNGDVLRKFDKEFIKRNIVARVSGKLYSPDPPTINGSVIPLTSDGLDVAQYPMPNIPKKDTNDFFLQKMIEKLKIWMLDHKVIREYKSDGKTVEVYVPYKETMAYTCEININAIHAHKMQDTAWVNYMLEDQDPVFYELIMSGQVKTTTMDQLYKWFRTIGTKKYPIRHPQSRNRRTIHATKKGWFNLKKIKELGMLGISLYDADLSYYYVEYKSEEGSKYVDEDTGTTPFCTDISFAEVDFEIEVYPYIKQRDHDVCEVLTRVLGHQLAKSHQINKLSELGEHDQNRLRNVMGYLGFSCLPGEPNINLALILEGKSGIGKGCLIRMLTRMIGSESATLEDRNTSNSQFSNVKLINYDVGRMVHNIVIPDLEHNHFIDMIPDIKSWLGNDAGRTELKNSNQCYEYNTKKLSYVSNTGGRHDSCPGSYIICTNKPEKVKIDEEGWQRRLQILSMQLPVTLKDASLETKASENAMFEMAHCVWEYGVMCKLMDTPDHSGKKPIFMNCRINEETGVSYILEDTKARMNDIIEGTSGLGRFKDFIMTNKTYVSGKNTTFDDVWKMFKLANPTSIGMVTCKKYCASHIEEYVDSNCIDWHEKKLRKDSEETQSNCLPTYEIRREGDLDFDVLTSHYFRDSQFTVPDYTSNSH